MFIRMESMKLTLSIPQKILNEAKIYSQKTHQPLSHLVSRYFVLLSQGMKESKGLVKISTKVKRATGLAKSDKKDVELLFEALSHKYR